MFGNQALRLLRDNWGFVLEPDFKGNVTERGAPRLARELYAMFGDEVPLSHDAPLTLNKTNRAAPGLTIHTAEGGESLAVDGGDSSFAGGDFSVDNPTATTVINTGALSVPTPIVTFGRRAAAGRPGFGFGNRVGAAPVPGGGNSNVFSLHLPALGDIAMESEAGTRLAALAIEDALPGLTSMGQVVAGEGSTYTVDLYRNGPSGGPTLRVQATVPQIADTEVIPVGTWIACVRRSVTVVDGSFPTYRYTYAFQPPVWI